jgi:hypothetical protein
MQKFIISIFCHIDDFLKELFWKDDKQCKLSQAEIITIALTGTRYFSGNFEKARTFLFEHGYIPFISKSRLNRRLHDIPEFFWHLLVSNLAMKNAPNCLHFLVDSFPIASCHNIRSARRGLFRGKKYQGYNASKKMWFTGLKVHVLSSVKGQPKEFYISPATMHDLKAFKNMYLGTIPRGATLFGDKAYTCQSLENELFASKSIMLLAERRSNSKRGQSMFYARHGRKIRKRIETAFSTMLSWLPKSIHAVTDKGFILKIMILISSFSFSFIKC